MAANLRRKTGTYFNKFLEEEALSNATQPLDDFFFLDSTFTHVALEYRGSNSTIFDRSNMLVDSTLTLYPGADPDSNFVRQIKADFPQLKIVDSTKPFQKQAPDAHSIPQSYR
jgi:hypothetical protein